MMLYILGYRTTIKFEPFNVSISMLIRFISLTIKGSMELLTFLMIRVQVV